MGRKGGQSGRAVGHIADRLRVAVTRSLNILDRDKMPLDRLLAQAWKDDPIKTLSVVQRLLPQEFDVRQTVSVAHMHLDAVRQMSRIDQLTPTTTEPLVIEQQHTPTLDLPLAADRAGEGAEIVRAEPIVSNET